jgi:hypothetical protein
VKVRVNVPFLLYLHDLLTSGAANNGLNRTDLSGRSRREQAEQVLAHILKAVLALVELIGERHEFGGIVRVPRARQMAELALELVRSLEGQVECVCVVHLAEVGDECFRALDGLGQRLELQPLWLLHLMDVAASDIFGKGARVANAERIGSEHLDGKLGPIDLGHSSYLS